MMIYRKNQGIPYQAIFWGWKKKCPCCGKTPIYKSYLKPIDKCHVCHTQLGQIRTDDIAPYFTILLIGHIVAPILLISEKMFHPPVWVHLSLWPALVIILTLWGLPRVKGIAIAIMWHFNLTGDEN